jgi:hypothetical protein
MAHFYRRPGGRSVVLARVALHAHGWPGALDGIVTSRRYRSVGVGGHWDALADRTIDPNDGLPSTCSSRVSQRRDLVGAHGDVFETAPTGPVLVGTSLRLLRVETV